MFLPFQGTFFLARGVRAGSLNVTLAGVAGILGGRSAVGGLVGVSGGAGVSCAGAGGLSSATAAEVAFSDCGDAMAAVEAMFPNFASLSGLSVSTLERFRGWREDAFLREAREVAGTVARGVRKISLSVQRWSSPDCEPLSEECSLLSS